MPRLFALIVVVVVLGLPFWWFDREDPPRPEVGELTGEVRDENGPVAGAVVRIKGKSNSVESDRHGRFHLPTPRGTEHVTASKDGYLIAGVSAKAKPLALHLERLPVGDCERYLWVDPTPDATKPMNCGNCHAAIHDEWQRSGHAHSATNRRFLNLYDGTDWHGKRGVGWNLLKDHEQGADVCASCHAPTQKPGAFGALDMRRAADGSHGLSGVHCDFCHKIQGPGPGEFGLAHGRFQLQLLRPDPKEGHQLFFGPLDDVDRGEDSFSRFQRDSKLCAACHEGVVFGVPVYTTYSEWQSSPAASSGTSCQSCHMTPTGKMANIAPGYGGIRRDPATLGNHRFFDGSQLDMLRRCLKLDAATRRTAEGIAVDVSIFAQNVGHRVPTGFIDRQVILFVEAFAEDKQVALLKGEKLPDVLGPEAGKPGRLYAKVLTDGKSLDPAPFWKGDPATLIDTRLRPGETDRQTFLFPAGTDRVRIRLVHRRFWKQIAEEKRWPADEQLIVEREMRGPGIAE